MILVPCERVNHPSRSAPPSINLFCGAMATPRIDCLVALFFFFFSSRLLFRRSPHFFCVEVERFALFGCDCNQALFVRLTRTLIKWHGDGRGGFFFFVSGNVACAMGIGARTSWHSGHLRSLQRSGSRAKTRL